MKEKILQEVEGTEYAAEGADRGLDEAGIKDRPALKEAGGGYRQQIMDRFCKVE